MQYGSVAGETIIRYDNFPDHPDVTDHHVHRQDGTVESVTFDGLGPLLERFTSEVNAHGHDW